MGRKVTHVVPSNDQHAVCFTNGEAVTADLVVGADGAWSKVRALLTGMQPAYSGICFVEIALPAGHAAIDAIGIGTLIAVAPGKGIMMHRDANGGARGYAALCKPAAWSDGQASLAQVARQFEGWAPALTAFVRDSQIAPVVRPICALPVEIRWDRVPGVTLLGDAAHLMSPFAGEGANLAMYDGAELAKAILCHPCDLAAALAAYEQALFARSADVAAVSARNLDLFFGATAPRSVVRLFGGGQ